MDYSEFKRESIVRHQAEKLLDKDIIGFERRQALDDYEKVIEKKVKKEQEERKAKEEEMARLKAIDIKPHEALDKIIKHFNNPKKCPKAVVLFKDLVVKNFDSLEPDHVFYGLYELMENFQLLSTAEDKKHLYELFKFLDEKKEKILKDKYYKEVYRVWSYEGLVHTQVFTDDSFHFTNTVKKVKELFDELVKALETVSEDEPDEIPVQEEKKVEAKQPDVVSSIRNKLMKKKEEIPVPEPVVNQPKYEYKIPQECLDDIKKKKSLKEWKQKILFETTKDLFIMFKHAWAKPTIKQFFDQLYLQREVFNEDQKKIVEDLKARLSNLKGVDLVKGFQRQDLDSKILSNPLNSRNEVKDARGTAFSFDNLGTWTGRQSGL